MGLYSITYLILLVPIIMFLFLGLTGHKMKPAVSGILGTLGMGFSWIMSCLVAFNYFGEGLSTGVYEKIVALNVTWLQFTDTLHIDMGVLLDPISVMMLVVITTVSLMVHIYSNGYMKGEKGFHRFYAFLSFGDRYQLFPNVYFLGIGRGFFLPPHQFLL